MKSYRQQGKKSSLSKPASASHIWKNITSSAAVNDWFNAFAESNHLDKAVSLKLNIVIDDIVANIISYAFAEVETPEVEVRLELKATAFLITFIDNGKPFNPFDQGKPDTSLSITERDIGGLGIHLCRELTDDVSYQRTNDNNIVKLTVMIPDENNS
jgi:anti-sigma regulatory factor (Ser/Thr protein kinase)